MRRIIINKGDKYSQLTILNEVESRILPCGENQRYVLCKCDCGKTSILALNLLRSKKIQSCGCARIKFNYSHGLSKKRIYRIWENMKKRCNNKNTPSYKYYGGRGITVCDRWLKFENFFEDMKDGYSDDLTIDRIDNNSHYCKENCRWVNMEVQNNNTRKNRYFVYQGTKKTSAQWARHINMSYQTFNSRVRSGWSIDKIINTSIL